MYWRIAGVVAAGVVEDVTGVRADLKVGVRADLKVGLDGWNRESNAAWTPLATIIP
jgi:hypothetical protein